MSGELESSRERLDKLETWLDSWEKNEVKTIPTVINDEADTFLQLNLEKLRKLTAEECGEGAYLLSQRALFIQQTLNRESARIGFCEAEIRRSIAKTCPGFKAYSYEERRDQAVQDNQYALNLQRLMVAAEARVNRLSYVASKVNDMKQTLLELQQTKRRDRHGQ